MPCSAPIDDTCKLRHGCKRWLASLLLTLPVAALYLAHYLGGEPGQIPTGFIQLDQPFYAALAREYHDPGAMSFHYSYPFTPAYDLPAIYFQPQTWGLGLVTYLTGINPGLAIIIFHFLAAILFSRIAIAVYETIFGLRTKIQWLVLPLFFWGGGLLCFSGIGHELAIGHCIRQALLNAFKFDPINGWWMLNLGRNAAVPFEAYYHALFLGAILFVLRRQYLPALLLCYILCLSSPFSGLELILIITAWSGFEIFFVRRNAVPWIFFAICIAIILLLGVQVAALKSFPEHKIVEGIYLHSFSDDIDRMLMHAVTFIPAYVLVGGLTLWNIRTPTLFRSFLAIPHNRFFLVWAVVAFALANNEFAMKPVQPLHFTRGYIWTPLFLMGGSALFALISNLREKFSKSIGAIAIMLLGLALISDNVLWFSGVIYERTWVKHNKGDFYLTHDQRDLFDWLDKQRDLYGCILIAADTAVNVLAPCYTPLRCWSTRTLHTPNFRIADKDVDEFFDKGIINSAWHGRPLIIITGPREEIHPDTRDILKNKGVVLYENKDYQVYKFVP